MIDASATTDTPEVDTSKIDQFIASLNEGERQYLMEQCEMMEGPHNEADESGNGPAIHIKVVPKGKSVKNAFDKELADEDRGMMMD